MIPLTITQGAIDKAEHYAKKAYQKHKSECYGWLLTPRGGESAVVRDVMLTKQYASGAHCEVDGESVIKSTSIAMRNGYRLVGWWHSHASHEPFHSETDRKNSFDVLNVLQFTSYHMIADERDALHGPLETTVLGDCIRIKEREGTGVLEVVVNGPFIIEHGSRVERVFYKNIKKVGYCFALTVNARKEKPVAQVALADNGETRLEDTTIEIMDSDTMIEEEVATKICHE